MDAAALTALRADCFAEDIPLPSGVNAWTEEKLREYAPIKEARPLLLYQPSPTHECFRLQVRLVKERGTGQPRGFCFVEFFSIEVSSLTQVAS